MSLFDDQGNIVVPTEDNDNFTLVDDAQTVDLLGGNDILIVSGSGNTVNGSAGNDDLTDDGSETGNTLNGGAGNDSLFGGTSGTLDGGTGRDVIFASPNGQGNNTISGGTGRDLFYIATGEIPGLLEPPVNEIPDNPNIIKDFQTGLDYLVLSLAPGLTLFDQLVITDEVVDNITKTTISFDDTADSVDNAKPIAILEGVAKEDLSADNVKILTPENPNVPALPEAAPDAPQGNLAVDHSPVVGETIGTVIATDPDEDEIASYAITGGTGVDLFTVDTAGVVTIKDEAAVTVLEANPDTTYTLTITATDTLGLTSEAGDFDVPQLENRPPEITNETFRWRVEPEVDYVLFPQDQFLATDPDNDPLTYSFTENGNPNNLFTLVNGQLVIASTEGLTSPQTVEIFVTDGELNATGTVNAQQNNAPVFGEFNLQYDDTPSVGEAIGTVIATDADTEAFGDTLTYTTTGGTGFGLFAIDSSTGVVTIIDQAAVDALNANLNAIFNLTIEVTDPLGDQDTATFDITGTGGGMLNLDIDGNSQALPGTDGILTDRYLIRLSLGFDGLNQTSLTNAVAPDATRTDLAAINDYLAGLVSPDAANNIPLDIDGNSQALPGTDGILQSRYLIRLSLGFDGLNQAGLTNAVAPDATRTDLAAINDYLADLMPSTI